MMLAAPEFVVAEPVELLHQVEVAAELQQRVLADRMMRGEEGAELQTRHNGISRRRQDARGREPNPAGVFHQIGFLVPGFPAKAGTHRSTTWTFGQMDPGLRREPGRLCDADETSLACSCPLLLGDRR